MCLADGPWVINATFEVLRYGSGFTAMITGVGVPSEFAVHTIHEIALLNQPSQTCSGGFIKTQLYAICCCFFAIGEYNLTTQRQRLTYEVSLKVYTERHAALHFMAVRLQARAARLHVVVCIF